MRSARESPSTATSREVGPHRDVPVPDRQGAHQVDVVKTGGSYTSYPALRLSATAPGGAAVSDVVVAVLPFGAAAPSGRCASLSSGAAAPSGRCALSSSSFCVFVLSSLLLRLADVALAMGSVHCCLPNVLSSAFTTCVGHVFMSMFKFSGFNRHDTPVRSIWTVNLFKALS